MSKTLTIQQAADELGVSTRTLRRWEESGHLTTEREEETKVRLYDSHKVGYWKKFLELNKAIRVHLKLLDAVKKDLDKHAIEQDYIPGRPLKLMTEEELSKYDKAYKAMKKWEEDFRRLIDELASYPKSMHEIRGNAEEKE